MDRGRPTQIDYPAIVRALNDQEIYTGATIAQLAKAKGLIPAGLSKEGTKQTLSRIRQNMNALARRYNFPLNGDGKIMVHEIAPIFGWRGSRWKEAYFAKRRIPSPLHPRHAEKAPNEGDPV